MATTTDAIYGALSRRYTYNTIGNINSGDQGTYGYAGTGYANPHAPTIIGNGTASTTYAYDANGNLTQATTGATTTIYTWDYLNRLTSSSVNGAATTTYGYDYLGNRVFCMNAIRVFS